MISPQLVNQIRHPLSRTLILLSLIAPILHAAEPAPKKEPEIPAGLAFVRSVDLDTFIGVTNRHQTGMQTGRLRLRYLDPDVNAFVGLLVGVHHFNDDLRLGDPQNPTISGYLCNWGGAFGVVRGQHLWELDLMGTILSSHLGFATAIVGEHRLVGSLRLVHRTEFNFFTGDVLMDADQGLDYMVKPWWGVSAGYRWFTSQHMDRSGPHIGLRIYFESPKIPFIFPSIG